MKLGKDVVLKIVKSSEVESLSLAGWQLVSTVEEDRLEIVYDQTPKPPPPPNYNSYYTPGETMSVSRTLVVRETKFIMSRGQDSHLKVLEEEKTAALKRVSEAEKACAEVTLKLELASKKLSECAKDLTDTKEQLITSQETLVKRNSENFQYMQNERALRKAIGDVGFDQIVKNEAFTGSVAIAGPGMDVVVSAVPDRFERLDSPADPKTG